MNAKKTLILALVWACNLFLSYSAAWAWQTSINGTANSSDWASTVAVDPDGNVVAAGSTNWICVADDGGICYAFASALTVIKFDGMSGQELWRREINGIAGSANGALALAVDGAGNVVTVGSTNGICVDYDCYVYVSNFIVVKFDGVSGTELWRKEIGDGFANAVAVDAASNVVAAGTTVNTGTGYDFTVVKFDGVSGVELWRRVINGTANYYDTAEAVAVDAAGNVVAAGITTNNGGGFDLTVVKFDGVSGAELWRKELNGTANHSDQANAVAVDAAGNVVAAGSTMNNGTGYGDFTVVKFDGASGQEQWRQVINGTANGNDSANAVAVDATGNVVAAGSTQNSGTGFDFTVVKLIGGGVTQLTLTVSKSGTGTGTVTSNLADIDCGGDCSEAYDLDTVVTLTATAAPDSFFAGFSGDADCVDGVVTMNADKTCTATFTRQPITVTFPNGGQSWAIGSRQTIQWMSSGVSGKVKIQLSRNGGSTWTNLVTNTPNDGSQSWRVTKPATTQARFRICSVKSPSICDTSDANFTIQ